MVFNKITISGKVCTGKTTLLKNLEQKLKWSVFMTGKLFRDYVDKNNFNLEQVREQNNELTKKIDYQVRDMIHAPGNLIVDGWMSGIMAKDVTDVLKVLLVCDDSIRYQRFADREKIDIDEAKKRVEERQNNWFQKIEKIHHIKREEFADRNKYDLVLDTSNISSEEVLENVLKKMF